MTKFGELEFVFPGHTSAPMWHNRERFRTFRLVTLLQYYQLRWDKPLLPFKLPPLLSPMLLLLRLLLFYLYNKSILSGITFAPY